MWSAGPTWFVLCLLFSSASCLSPKNTHGASRRSFIGTALVSSTSVALPLATTAAEDTLDNETFDKVSDDAIKKIVLSDIIDRQFLATGRLTKSIYKPTATFTDEIDTYGLDQWMKGTQKLFVGEKSSVRLVGDVDVSHEKVEFRFDEDLMFRIPFNPTVSLTGRVVLAREPATGLITSYQEFWDQDVLSVIKTAKF